LEVTSAAAQRTVGTYHIARALGHGATSVVSLAPTSRDAARGVAAYALDGELHLLRLSDGAGALVGDASAARFGESGLFYACEGPYAWRGRIRFVPFARLPLR
jgi:hypothetical protein